MKPADSTLSLFPSTVKAVSYSIPFYPIITGTKTGTNRFDFRKIICIIIHLNIKYTGFCMFLYKILHKWCDRQELNLHGVSHKILSLARLPVPPRSHFILQRITLYTNPLCLSTFFCPLSLKIFLFYSVLFF